MRLLRDNMQSKKSKLDPASTLPEIAAVKRWLGSKEGGRKEDRKRLDFMKKYPPLELLLSARWSLFLMLERLSSNISIMLKTHHVVCVPSPTSLPKFPYVFAALPFPPTPSPEASAFCLLGNQYLTSQLILLFLFILFI